MPTDADLVIDNSQLSFDESAKILIDQSTDQIVGAHLLGHEYGELINTLGLAIKVGLTTRQLKSATAAYPTVGSDLGSML